MRRDGCGPTAWRRSLVAMMAVLLAVAPALAAEKRHETRKKPRGKVEHIDCMVGTDDRQARIAIEAIAGRIQSFAYYGKTTPRTCSMDVRRDDAYSSWEDHGDATTVTLVDETGAFLIDHGRGRFHFIFRDIDRMRYCGMDGKMNGSLTVVRGKGKYTCTVDRIIIESAGEQE